MLTLEQIFDQARRDTPPATQRFIDLQAHLILEIEHTLDRLGWTNKELATRIGCSPSQVTRWLTGRSNLTLYSIAQIEAALGEDILQVREPTSPATRTPTEPAVSPRPTQPRKRPGAGQSAKIAR